MIKKQNGITLVSLIIVIAVMTLVASTVVTMSLDRFEINSLRKMFNDIELLQDKVSNYYLKYGALPVLRDGTNAKVIYTYTTLDFNKNSADNENYYILDLEAMSGISLNYGKEGFKNPNTSDDVYIINEASHTVYYPKGMELQGEMHYTLGNIEGVAEDVIPPSTPQIKVISGTQNAKGLYTSEVELELVPGREDGNVAKQTEFSTDNGITWKNIATELDNNIYKIAKTGNYSIKLRSHDKNDNTSEEVALDLSVEIRVRNTFDVTSTNQSWLELKQSYAGTASQFKIYGNSIQKGTPSPDAPVEVESVGDLANLLNSNATLGKVGAYLGISTTGINKDYTLKIKLKEGKTVPSGVYFGFVFYRTETSTGASAEWLISNGTINSTYGDGNSYGIVTFNPSAYYLTGICCYNGTQAVWDSIMDAFEVTWVEGSYTNETIPEYVEYDGKYIIPVKVSGKNLFDISKFKSYTNSADAGAINNGDRTITLSRYDPDTSKNKISEVCPDLKVGQTITWQITNGSYVWFGGRIYQVGQKITITQEMLDDNSFGLYGIGGTNVENPYIISDIIAYEGDSSLEYVPYVEPQTFNIYLDEPLRKLGAYEDYIDLKNKTLYRVIKQGQINGSSTFGKFGNVTDYSAFYMAQDDLIDYETNGKINISVLSSKFKYHTCGGANVNSSWTSEYEIGGSLATTYKRICFTLPNTIADIASAKEWIADNPLDYYYPTSEPINQTIELPELKIFDEYTKIEVLTEVPPSKIEATYEGYELKY